MRTGLNISRSRRRNDAHDTAAPTRRPEDSVSAESRAGKVWDVSDVGNSSAIGKRETRTEIDGGLETVEALDQADSMAKENDGGPPRHSVVRGFPILPIAAAAVTVVALDVTLALVAPEVRNAICRSMRLYRGVVCGLIGAALPGDLRVEAEGSRVRVRARGGMAGFLTGLVFGQGDDCGV